MINQEKGFLKAFYLDTLNILKSLKTNGYKTIDELITLFEGQLDLLLEDEQATEERNQ